MPVVRNWRDQEPYIGHINAIIWPFFRAADSKNVNPPELARLRGMNSFVKHALQGRQHSDYHHHDSIEQMYYILRGSGQMLLGDTKRDVREGDAVYVPVNLPHQAFNDGDGWMEHLIVSCPLPEIVAGIPAVRNWRNTTPTLSAQKSILWRLLARADAATPDKGGVLQRMSGVDRHAVQGRQSVDPHRLEGIEQVYFILSGRGVLVTEEGKQTISEGSAVYIAPGVEHRIENESDDWIEYVVFAAPVEE